MKLEKIKMIAQKLMNCGSSKVWFNPESIGKIKEAMTSDDIRALIKDGTIKKLKLQQHSRGNARTLAKKKRRGRKRGFGKRTGTRKARIERKRTWMKNVRAQRKYLTELRKNKKVSGEQYSKVYSLIKGGYFKGKRYIDSYLNGEK